MKNKIKPFIYSIISSIALFFASILIYIVTTWDNISLNEIIFHLNTETNGVGSKIIIKFVIFILVPQIIFYILFFTNRFFTRKILTYSSIFLLFLSLSYFIYASNNSIEYIIKQSSTSNFIENEYINPRDINIKFNNKRNLIHIYLESIESSFADIENGGIFEKNLIPQLTELAHKHIDFSGITQKLNGSKPIAGTTWTAAGIFAQYAGIPLNLYVAKSYAHTQEAFYPGIVTLGDILEHHGYKQVFLLGSKSEFASKNKLFRDHGKFEIIDYNFMIQKGMIPRDYHKGWGIEDSKLFEIAKDILLKLSKQQEPFNLVILTVDTHTPDSYVDDSCKEIFTNKYRNSIYCADSQIDRFVTWIKNQEFYKNTTIVITGDHLTRETYFVNNPKGYIRKAYSCYINTAHSSFNDERFREYSSFDHFPTILSAIGADIPGNRLGLGTNLFSGLPTLSEQYGYEFQDNELLKRSTFLEDLGKIDKTSIYNFRKIQLETIKKRCSGEIEYIELENKQDQTIINLGGWVLHSLSKKETPDSILLLRSKEDSQEPTEFSPIENINRPELSLRLKVDSHNEFGFNAIIPYDHSYWIGYRRGNVIYQCENMKVTPESIQNNQ